MNNIISSFSPRWEIKINAEQPKAKAFSTTCTTAFVQNKRCRYNLGARTVMERLAANYSESLVNFIHLKRLELHDANFPAHMILDQHLAPQLMVSRSAIEEWPEGSSGKKMGVGDMIAFIQHTGDFSFLDKLHDDAHKFLGIEYVKY